MSDHADPHVVLDACVCMCSDCLSLSTDRCVCRECRCQGQG